jgi:hypothetical protein
MRTLGINAILAMAFAPTYAGIPTTGYYRMPFSANGLGEEQGLLPSDILGYGRNPQAATDGPIDNAGDLTVPVDLRAFGMHLKMLFGSPTTTQGVAASGKITFAAQPAANDTITVGGQVFTYKASAPAANQILIGTTLADTIRNTVWALNASAVVGVAAARYSTDADASAVFVTHKTIGTAGNSFTLAASVATPSGATLAGGSASGPYNHVFVSGAQSLPNAVLEVGHPDADTADYTADYGVMANTLAISMQRSGQLSAVLGLIARGTTAPAATPVGGAPTDWVIERFVQAQGVITDAGVPLANLPSAQLNYSNGLSAAEGLRGDGRIEGVDAGGVQITPQLVARFANRAMYNKAISGIPLDAEFGWRIAAGKSLTFRLPGLRLPRRTKKPIDGPGGVQQTFAAQGETAVTLGQALVVTLVNDVASY